jgi:hypothetical protein
MTHNHEQERTVMSTAFDSAFEEPSQGPSDLDLAFSPYPDRVNPFVAANMNVTEDDPEHLGAVCKYLNTHGYSVRHRHFPGHHIYPKGLWSIHDLARSGEGIKIEGDLVRYADFDQMREISAAYKAGLLEEMLSAVHAEGLKEGPVRVGKPPIDPKGNPIVEVNNGSYGPLPEECKWIEEHDKVFVQYMGTDENWVSGCWAIETGNPDPDYYDHAQIMYIAHEVLGMPRGPKGKAKPRVNKNSWHGANDPLDAFDDAFGEVPSVAETQLIPDEWLEDEERDPLALALIDDDPLAGAFGDDPIPF